jgi:hypothetical protein
MYSRAISISAQTPPAPFEVPRRSPGVPQFFLTPQARASAETQAALRQFLKNNSLAQSTVCAIPLLEVLLPKNLEQMPVLRPPAGNIDNMQVIVPAPPCPKEKP